MIKRKIQSLKKLWKVTGGSLTTFFKIIFIDYLFRILKIKEKHFYLNLKKFNKSFSVVLTNEADLSVFKEYFLHEDYNFNLPDNVSVIFDLGANVGYSSIYFSLKYPKALIYAYEPDPKNFSLLMKNTKNFPNINVFKMAVGDRDGEITFFSNSKSGVSSSFIKRNNNDVQISVPVKKLDTILKELSLEKIDLLKFNIEGAEEGIFMSDTFPSDKIYYLVGEIHGDLIKSDIKELCQHISKDFSIVEKRISKNRILISGKSFVG